MKNCDSKPPQEKTITLGRAAFLSFLSSVSTLGLSVVRSKVTAIILGPRGMGMAAEVQQLITLANVPVDAIVGAPLISQVAAAHGTGEQSTMESAYRSAMSLAIALSSLGGLMATVLGFWLLPHPWGASAWPLSALGALGVLLSYVALIPLQVLLAMGQFRSVTFISTSLAAIVAIVTSAGTFWFGLLGQFAGAALGALLTIPVAFYAARRVASGFKWGLGWGFDRRFVAATIKIGATSLVASFALQGSLLIIRTVLESHDGPEANGQFQAAWAIGSTYFSLVLGNLGRFVFPRYAAAQSKEQLAKEVEEATHFILRFSPPLILLAIAVREPIVQALYSKRFDVAVMLVGYQMVGDAGKAITWAQAGPLLYRGKLGAFLFSEIIGVGGLALLTAIWVPRYGVVGVGYAYAINHLLTALESSVILRFACGLQVPSRRLIKLAAVFCTAFICLHLCEAYTESKWFVIIFSLAWLARDESIRTKMAHVVRSVVVSKHWLYKS